MARQVATQPETARSPKDATVRFLGTWLAQRNPFDLERGRGLVAKSACPPRLLGQRTVECPKQRCDGPKSHIRLFLKLAKVPLIRELVPLNDCNIAGV